MSVILGINSYKHDAAAALLIDGKLVGAAEEERFLRIKHFAGYPNLTIDYLLENNDLSVADIDHIAFYMLPKQIMRENITYSKNYIAKPGGLYFLLSQLNGARRMNSIEKTIREHLGAGLRAEIHFVEHHIAHADAGFYCSGFDSAAVLTMDGVGERDTSILAEFTRDGHRVFTSSRYPNSPGVYYSAVTRYLGFMPDNDEYKVMGLASYGKPEYIDIFREIISRKEGRIVVDTRKLNIHRGVHTASFSTEAQKILGLPRKKGEEITPRHMNIACSAQQALEEVGLGLAKYLREITGNRKLVISGGVALNCVMNGRLERESGFDEIYPLPAPHDAGTSIGSAVQVHRKVYPEIPLVAPSTMYLGPEFTEAEIEKDIAMAKLTWTKPQNIADKTAEMIEKGMVVGFFHGKLEFGPRALGNRSILADPRREDMKDIVNNVVKHREAFRPFCPSCMEEHAGEYFEGCGQARYMIKTYPVVPGKKEIIPSVTHVDGTARVQTVTRELNPLYYDIIDCFYKRTGVPVVLNTSFNIRGEPIVAKPIDAVRCFYGTGIDVLVMPPFIIKKKTADVPEETETKP